MVRGGTGRGAPPRMVQNAVLDFAVSAADLAVLDQLTDTATQHLGTAAGLNAPHVDVPGRG